MNPSGTVPQQVAVSDIVKQLDFATRENLRLKGAIENNSSFMERKIQEISKNQQAQQAQRKLSSYSVTPFLFFWHSSLS